MQNTFTNISCYKFTGLSQLKDLRASLLDHGIELKLKGTVLLSQEGINLFVSGAAEAIDAFVSHLRGVPGLEDLTPKKSLSSHQPFNRLLVRIKKEIIAFGVEGINPSQKTSPKLPPLQLKQWLDEGKAITLLDTRNDYEINLGTFENAKAIGVKHFRDFPKAVQSLPAELKKQPIVMFCTGGIRCEKAGPYMESQGFEQIFQLDGGILKYFEECGSSHYRGDCFVFDQRVGVDPMLRQSDYGQCFACLTPLTAEEQKDSRFKEGKSCPYCFISDAEQMNLKIAERHAAINKLMTPLPGSKPYENFRPVKVSAAYEGYTVSEFLNSVLKHVSFEEWANLFKEGQILNPAHQIAKPTDKVKAGERYFHAMRANIEPEVSTDVKILYEDEAIIVLIKPAPLPVHPCGRYNRNTLQYILDGVYAPLRPRPAHRLDANTTGVMVISKTRFFAGVLQSQFEKSEVKKEYLARVIGSPISDFFECRLPISDKTHETGSRCADEEGLPAETFFEVKERLKDGTSILKVKPITGRTNQIRVHLWELGYPIYGEQLYLPNKQLGNVQTNTLKDIPLFLHAQSLEFTHPLTKKRMYFENETPSYFSSH